MAKHVYTRKEVCKEMKKEADSLLAMARAPKDTQTDKFSYIKLLEEQNNDLLRHGADTIMGFVDKLKAKT